MDKETADAMRGLIRRVTIKKINDEGEMQTASVEVADGIIREDVEVAQAFGQVSHAPEDGGLAIAISIGGDQGDMMILPIGNPSTRMGKTPKGTVGHANKSGDRVLVYPDGTVEIASASTIVAKVGGVSMTITAAGVAFEGGTLTHNGKNIGHDHGHTKVVRGSDTSGPPVPAA